MYGAPPGTGNEKKADLLALCKMKVTPSAYRWFFQNLTLNMVQHPRNCGQINIIWNCETGPLCHPLSERASGSILADDDDDYYYYELWNLHFVHHTESPNNQLD